MLRFSFLALLAIVSPAQTGTKPPADVDQALRARIREFYDMQVKGEFRKAEAFVAEDTKDVYYNLGKPKYKSIELVRIEYSDNFTRAQAVMNREQYIMAPYFPSNVPLKGQFVSTWKLEDGKWCWYLDPETLRETPFGKIGPGPAAGTGVPPMPPATIPTSPDFVLNRVKPDKTSIALKRGESGQVTLANNAPGTMKLVAEGKPAGVEVGFDHSELKAGAKAVATVAAGKDARPGVLSIRIEPTGEVISIEVVIE